MVFAGETDPDGRNLGPLRLDHDPGSLGVDFIPMGPGTDLHTDLAFCASGRPNLDHDLLTGSPEAAKASVPKLKDGRSYGFQRPGDRVAQFS
jgi:hypothetical protein